MSQQRTSRDVFLFFSPFPFFLTGFAKVRECGLWGRSCSSWGPVSKLWGLEKWESNAWLFVNCLASPRVQPEFVSKKKNKVTWTFSWLFPPASPLFPPFMATGILQRLPLLLKKKKKNPPLASQPSLGMDVIRSSLSFTLLFQSAEPIILAPNVWLRKKIMPKSATAAVITLFG